MERRTRRRFTREFKVEAVQLATHEGISVARVAHDLGMGESVLRRWCRQYARTRRMPSAARARWRRGMPSSLG